MIYMVREPAMQARIHAEIDQVTGGSASHRRPSLDDRDAMPFTAATLLEVLRKGNIVPQGVHHMAHRSVST
jgi:hypothetical protein